MEAKASARHVRVTPQKARRVVDMIRGKAATDADSLFVSEAYVDEGPTLKRFRPRAQGRAYRIRKRTSHITIEVESIDTPTTRKGRRA